MDFRSRLKRLCSWWASLSDFTSDIPTLSVAWCLQTRIVVVIINGFQINEQKNSDYETGHAKKTLVYFAEGVMKQDIISLAALNEGPQINSQILQSEQTEAIFLLAHCKWLVGVHQHFFCMLHARFSFCWCAKGRRTAQRNFPDLSQEVRTSNYNHQIQG